MNTEVKVIWKDCPQCGSGLLKGEIPGADALPDRDLAAKLESIFMQYACCDDCAEIFKKIMAAKDCYQAANQIKDQQRRNSLLNRAAKEIARWKFALEARKQPRI